MIPGKLPELDKLMQRVMVEQGIDDRVLKRLHGILLYHSIVLYDSILYSWEYTELRNQIQVSTGALASRYGTYVEAERVMLIETKAGSVAVKGPKVNQNASSPCATPIQSG